MLLPDPGIPWSHRIDEALSFLHITKSTSDKTHCPVPGRMSFLACSWYWICGSGDIHCRIRVRLDADNHKPIVHVIARISAYSGVDPERLSIHRLFFVMAHQSPLTNVWFPHDGGPGLVYRLGQYIDEPPLVPSEYSLGSRQTHFQD